MLYRFEVRITLVRRGDEHSTPYLHNEIVTVAGNPVHAAAVGHQVVAALLVAVAMADPAASGALDAHVSAYEIRPGHPRWPNGALRAEAEPEESR